MPENHEYVAVQASSLTKKSVSSTQPHFQRDDGSGKILPNSSFPVHIFSPTRNPHNSQSSTTHSFPLPTSSPKHGCAILPNSRSPRTHTFPLSNPPQLILFPFPHTPQLAPRQSATLPNSQLPMPKFSLTHMCPMPHPPQLAIIRLWPSLLSSSLVMVPHANSKGMFTT